MHAKRFQDTQMDKTLNTGCSYQACHTTKDMLMTSHTLNLPTLGNKRNVNDQLT
ncbi:unnamed protein product, partial [Staurois parvus]